jgi:hypothetical protein
LELDGGMLSENGMTKTLAQIIERITGRDIDSIRRETVEDGRARVEKEKGQKMRFVSYSPFIGRGNVLGSLIEQPDEVERDLDQCLK